MLRPKTKGAFVGEVAFVNAVRFGADGGVRVFRLRLRCTLVFLQVTLYTRADSRCVVRSWSHSSSDGVTQERGSYLGIARVTCPAGKSGAQEL
jgi:hypothetical protein